MTCLHSRTLAHVGDTDARQGQHLVCAPLMTSSGAMTALVVVRQMPFLALNADNLQLMQMILTYYADGIEQTAFVQPVLDHVPSCPRDFALQLARLGCLQKQAGVVSSLVGLVFSSRQQADIVVNQLTSWHRALDHLWIHEHNGQTVAILLLALTEQEGVDGYIVRLRQAIEALPGAGNVDLTQGITLRRAAVNAALPDYGLSHLLSGSHDHA